MYWGRPVIYEPGSNQMLLCEAVELVQQHADRDAWLIRVTGNIASDINTLIPSTEDAITSENFASDHEHGRSGRSISSSEFDESDSQDDTQSSRLYSCRVEFGVVTDATWLMIQALPQPLRRQYEQLRVDSIVVYPRKLVAANGLEYDEFVSRYGDQAIPWSSVLEMDQLRLTTRETIDGEYVSLRFPIGEFAARIGDFRRQAQQRDGKNSGSAKAWKEQANTMYGVLASPHLMTNNFVAANQITATARALAYAMTLALNAIQVITDGCTYRLDQIPACTLEECLRIQPDYPLRRAEADSGIPFVDPASIPKDDAGFTQWYRQHVKRFFGVAGPEYDALFGIHQLEHKKIGTGQSVAFDALACDGCGNYVKCTRDDDGVWHVGEIKARAYGRESKKVLQDWIFQTYSADNLESLAPVAEDRILLSYKEAGQKACSALESGIPEVYYPLGLANQRSANYKVMKPSAFMFQTPQQRRTIVKQIERFQDTWYCGLELLALRRSYGDRRQGSLVDVALAIYEEIQRGSHDLTSCLNMNRLGELLQQLAAIRGTEIEAAKQLALQDLYARIDVRNAKPGSIVTGYIVNQRLLRS